jgi:enterochelin esterase-like enzyme
MLKILKTISFTLFLLLITGCQVVDSTPLPAVDPARLESPSPTPAVVQFASVTPTARICTETKGRIVNKNISTKLLSSPMNVNIYLPPCYGVNQGQKYPVLYMFHGQAADNDQWIKLGLATTADQMISDHVIQPMIIVMPYEVTWHLGPEDSNFDDALISVVIPYVEENFLACNLRSCRAAGGLSRGGNWAVYLGFAHPSLFTAIGSHSGPLFYGEIGRIEKTVPGITPVSELPAIYIDVGKKDEQKEKILEFANILRSVNIEYEFFQNEGRHEEAYWSAHLEDYLAWYSSQLNVP